MVNTDSFQCDLCKRMVPDMESVACECGSILCRECKGGSDHGKHKTVDEFRAHANGIPDKPIR